MSKTMLTTPIVIVMFIAVFQSPPSYAATREEIEDLLKRIEEDTDRFRDKVDDALDRTRLDDTKAEDRIQDFVNDFENATDRLKDRFEDKKATAGDVREVLVRAERIDDFMRRRALGPETEASWRNLRGKLVALARAYQIAWRLDVGDRPYTLTEEQARELLERIEGGADRFRSSLKDVLGESRVAGTQAEDRINESVQEFEQATDRLRERFNEGQSAKSDVEEVLRRAARINEFVERHPRLGKADDDWRQLRRSLDQLAQAYRVAWHW